jgi:hypothetical protein
MTARQSNTARAFAVSPIQKHTLGVALTVLALVAGVQPASAGDQSLVLGMGNIIAPPLPLAVH